MEDRVVEEIQVIQRYFFSGYVNILGDTMQCKPPFSFAEYLLFIYEILIT